MKWSNAKSQMEGLLPVYTLAGEVFRNGRGETGEPKRKFLANGYRLPTDNEWEWAARGGLSSQNFIYSGSNDANSVAWFGINSSGASVNLHAGKGTWPVGTKNANELGIYDMSGNVREWCEDIFSAEVAWPTRVFRGGSWFNSVLPLSWRSGSQSSASNEDGFRLARNIGPKISITGTIPEAMLNQPYAGFTFGVAGSNDTATWSIPEGNLPPGMTLNPTTGTLSGTPTTAGTYTFALRVDAGGYWDEVEVSFDIKKLLLTSVAQSFTTTLQPGIWHGFLLGPSSENFAYIPKITPKASVTQGGRIEKYVVQPEFDGEKWNDVLRIIASPDNPSFEVDVRVFKIGEHASVPTASTLSQIVLHRDFGLVLQTSDWKGFILDETSNKVAYVPKITPRPNATAGAYIERVVVQSEFNGSKWNDVLRIATADTGNNFEADTRVFKIKQDNEIVQDEKIAGISISSQFQTTLQPGVWHGFILGQTSKEVSYIPEITPISSNATNGAFIEKYTVQSEFNGINWYDVLRMVVPVNQASTPVHVRIYKLVAP
jgi:hypothetical protein